MPIFSQMQADVYYATYNKQLKRPVIFICLAIGTLLINGCQNKQKIQSNNQASQIEEINRLKLRVTELERQIGSRTKHSSSNHFKNTTSLIKSITFRIGTTDDRLRIYWSDGSTNNLPCTKEQSIWVCG